MDVRNCGKNSMGDVRKLIDLFNSYTNEISATSTAPSKQLTRSCSARLSDIPRSSLRGGWSQTNLLNSDSIERISPKQSNEKIYGSRSTSPMSTIDRSSTVRASVIKSIVATCAKGLTRPQTAYGSAPGNGSHLTVPHYEQLNDPNTDSASSSPWMIKALEFGDELPPRPRWMDSVARMSNVQPAVCQNWNLVNGQLRSKLQAVERLPQRGE